MGEPIRTILLAETIARRRQDPLVWLKDTAALKKAASVGGTDADRLYTWVNSLAGTEPFNDALNRLGSFRVGAQWGVVVIATLLAYHSTGGALTSDPARVINVPYVILSLIVVPLTLLVLWIVLFFWPARRAMNRGQAANGGLLGRAVLWLSETFLLSFAKFAESREAYSASITAVFALLRRNPNGRWVFSATTHAIWAAWIFGALLSLVVQLYFRGYDPGWETTIGSDELIIRGIGVVALAPGLLGLTTPDMELIRESRFGSNHIPGGPRTWGLFLIWSVILWTLVPRLCLACCCYWRARRSVQSTSMDLAMPLFQQALSRIRALEEAPLPQGRTPNDIISPGTSPVYPPTFGGGDKLVLLGLELDQTFPWPPQINHSTNVALANIRTRSDEHTAIARLTEMTPPPDFIVVIASIAHTPDRGCVDILREIGRVAHAPILLILTEVGRLKERKLTRDQQEQIWRDRARRAGVAAIKTLDLGALEQVTQSELKAFLNSNAVNKVTDPPSDTRDE